VDHQLQPRVRRPRHQELGAVALDAQRPGHGHDDVADVVRDPVAPRRDHHQPTARRHHPAGLGQQSHRVGHQLEHPDDRRVRHCPVRHRQPVAVGYGHARAQPGLGEGQHGRRQVHPHDRVTAFPQGERHRAGPHPHLQHEPRSQVRHDAIREVHPALQATPGGVVGRRRPVERDGPHRSQSTRWPWAQEAGLRRARSRFSRPAPPNRVRVQPIPRHMCDDRGEPAD
jgi:hypothetical protein